MQGSGGGSGGTLYLTMVLQAQNAITGVLQQIGSQFGVLGTAVAAATAGAVAFGASSVQAASSFQAGLTSLVTGAGEAQSNIKAVSAGILQMSTDTGTSTQQLISGMYMIESAGYHGAAGLSVLQAAAEGAKVGNADLGTTANALTTILTDYHQPASQAVGDMNALTATVASGKTHLQDLASAMGSVLPLASSLGISFPQVAGAIAVMTNSGMDAQRASMNLANAIRSLAAPSTTATKAMAEVGISAQQLKDTLSTQGLTGAIQLVEQHVGQTFPAGSVQAVQAFKNIMGGATGYNVALMVGGKNMAAYEQNVKNISAAMNAGGSSVQGWSAVQDTFNFQVQRADAAFQALQITVGTAFLPILTQLVGGVANAIGGFINWANQTGILQAAAQGLAAIMSQVGNVIQTVVQNITSGLDLGNQAQTWGQNLVTSFANGILGGQGVVGDAINAIINEVASFIGFMSPTEKGPGQDVDDWGPNMVNSFASGIINNLGAVTDAATQVAGQLQPIIDASTTVAQSSGTMSDNLLAGLTTANGIVTGGNATGGNGKGINMSGMTIAQARAVEALIRQNEALQKKQAAAATHAQHAQASAATKAAAALKKQQAAQAQSARLAADWQKALSESSSQAVQDLVNKSKQMLAAGNTAMATFYAQQADKLAASQKAAADKALKVQLAAQKKATTGLKHVAASAAGVGAALAGLPPKASTSALATVNNLAGGIAKGASTVQATVHRVTHVINQGWKNVGAFIRTVFGSLGQILRPTLQILGQILGGLWHTLLTVGNAVAKDLLPALSSLLKVVAPIVAGILQWIASSRIIPGIFNAINVILTIVIGAISILIKVIAAIITFFSQTQVGIAIFQALLVILGIVAAAIAVIGIVILSTMIPAFISWIAGAIAVGIANVIAFAPIILIILAVIAVVTIVILIIKNWGHIAHWLQGVWGAIANFFVGLWNRILAGLRSFVAWLQGLWHGLLTFLQNVAKIGLAALLVIFFGPILLIVALFRWLYNHNYYFKNLVDAIVRFFTVLFTWASIEWMRFVFWIEGIWKRITTTANIYWTLLVVYVQTQIFRLQKWLTGIWTTITTWLQTQWNRLAGMMDTAWRAVSTILSSAWNTYVATPLNILWKSISGWFTNLANQAYTSGSNFIQMLVNGISSGAGAIWNAVTNIANTIWKALGFHSPAQAGPASDSDQWMPNFVNMLTSGLLAGIPQMTQAVNRFAQPLQGLNPAQNGTVASPVSSISNAGGTHYHTYNITVPAVSTNNVAAARAQGQALAQALAQQLRGSGITPTLTIGGIQ